MSKHIFFIDPLEKLVVKKDSTLMLALEFQNAGHECYVMFEENFYYKNHGELEWNIYTFNGEFESAGYYLKSFKTSSQKKVKVDGDVVFHMRLDPPFDTRYLRYLWMLLELKSRGLRCVNDPMGIILNNEKLTAYRHPSSLTSYVGTDQIAFAEFVNELKATGNNEAIFKPLDLYQGIGVEKVDLNIDIESLKNLFMNRVKEYGGAIVVQAFIPAVREGEVRSVYYKNKEIGSILKRPKDGEFLANIAQGAAYESYQLTDSQRKSCEEICESLGKQGVDWVAFDIIGDYVSEVNVTCPGLIVEVSQATGKSLAKEILNHF